MTPGHESGTVLNAGDQGTMVTCSSGSSVGVEETGSEEGTLRNKEETDPGNLKQDCSAMPSSGPEKQKEQS